MMRYSQIITEKQYAVTHGYNYIQNTGCILEQYITLTVYKTETSQLEQWKLQGRELEQF